MWGGGTAGKGERVIARMAGMGEREVGEEAGSVEKD